jgi:hypothetical protein
MQVAGIVIPGVLKFGQGGLDSLDPAGGRHARPAKS